jgi:hypothetical protein
VVPNLSPSASEASIAPEEGVAQALEEEEEEEEVVAAAAAADVVDNNTSVGMVVVEEEEISQQQTLPLPQMVSWFGLSHSLE